MPEDTTENTDDELVPPEAGCPRCGEQRMDYLVWTEDGGRVECGTCGFVYQP